MVIASTNAAHEPVQALIDRWWDLGVAEAESHEQAITELEQTLRALSDWGQDLANQLEIRETKKQRLEHDVVSLRSRVTDLEKALQDRTQELLRAQEANNLLAAELQQTDIDPIGKSNGSFESADLAESSNNAVESQEPFVESESVAEALEVGSVESDEAIDRQAESTDVLAIDEAIRVSERFGKLRSQQSSKIAGV